MCWEGRGRHTAASGMGREPGELESPTLQCWDGTDAGGCPVDTGANRESVAISQASTSWSQLLGLYGSQRAPSNPAGEVFPSRPLSWDGHGWCRTPMLCISSAHQHPSVLVCTRFSQGPLFQQRKPSESKMSMDKSLFLMAPRKKPGPYRDPQPCESQPPMHRGPRLLGHSSASEPRPTLIKLNYLFSTVILASFFKWT